MRPWEIHPALVHFPLGLLLTAVAVDLFGALRKRDDLVLVATWMMLGGVVAGVVAAAAGLLAFFTVPSHTADAHTRMYWHLGISTAALVVFAVVGYVRSKRLVSSPVSSMVRGAGIFGAVLLLVTGYIGGGLILRGGAGVDPAILSPEVRGAHSHQHHEHEHEHEMEKGP
jgi:uncharacterized membrane protein